jgi:hypothetical protein
MANFANDVQSCQRRNKNPPAGRRKTRPVCGVEELALSGGASTQERERPRIQPKLQCLLPRLRDWRTGTVQNSCRPCENKSRSCNIDHETRAAAHFAHSGRENRLS